MGLDTVNTKINSIYNRIVDISRAKGLVGILILNKTGSLFFSKIKKNRPNMVKNNFQIAGFISAIVIYSQNFIAGDRCGLKLEDIDLGNQHFYIKTKNDIIFAYLVEKNNCSENIERYMQLIMEDFIEKYYYSHVVKFKGDLTPFHNFENVIEKYFEI